MTVINYFRTKPIICGIASLFAVLFLITLGWHSNDLPLTSSLGHKNDAVLLYVYHETPDARKNLQFFVDHALHDHMDFIFIINGPELGVGIPKRPNVRVVPRQNTCFDIGSYAEVLNADNAAVKNKYQKFILMNASTRGPFLPGWARQMKLCWSKIILNYLDDKTKIAGLSANCDGGHKNHIQSMMLVVDRIGLDLLAPALTCKKNWHDAVRTGEVQLLSLIQAAGYEGKVIWGASFNNEYKTNADYWANGCPKADTLYPNKYYGMDISPLDSIFVKVNRTAWSQDQLKVSMSPAGQHVLETYTKWADDSKYSSYDFC